MDSTPDESIYMDQDSVHPAHDDAGRSFLPPGFDSMEQYLSKLQEFLHQCEPITNLMIVDYFTTDSWETRMPQDWREAFESPQGKLSSLDLMELVSLGKLRDYKSSSAATHGGEQDASGPQDWPESLKAFVRMIKTLSINRTLDPDYSKFKDTLDIHLIPGMSPKKLHEVEILSGLMASYSKEHGIGSVIDLGAGQGYLSRVLAFQHQLCVLGVDSNTIQTCGAQTTQKRTEKLFVNKTRNKQNSAKKKEKKQAKAKDKDSKDTIVGCTTGDIFNSMSSIGADFDPVPLSYIHKPTSRPEEDESCKKISKKFKTEAGSSASGSDSGQAGTNKKPNSNSRKKKTKKINNSAKTTTPTIPTAPPTETSVCNGDSNMDPATKEAAETQGSTKAPMDSSNDPQMAQTPGSNFQLQHITHTITAATLPTLLKEHFPKISKPSTQHLSDHHGEEEHDVGRWTLCGLHACGDLTSNMVKLFLESSATCLFSVGCCYHWITERYDKDGHVVLDDGSHGFPLSSVFNARKAHLGDHAKMIACQSPERWLPYQKESEDAIHGHYFRALLHKLMVEKGLYPGPPAIAPVLGRMGKHRLKGFPHYLATALQRLKMPAEAITAEEAQRAYDTFLERDLYRIGIFWALRTMLGPLFEGMILLDRAMHLHETIMSRPNTKTASVQLVAGFDVVESPRNMVLIALKD
ncbi:Methyltransferase-like protein 25 [Haplosporangium bisporale]|nr:Methyltransferase-like protein 25 [Haplosporangium bisporale]